MSLHYIEIGAAQLGSVTGLAPKSPFLCVNRSPIQYGFPVGAKAIQPIQYSVNTTSFPGFSPRVGENPGNEVGVNKA